MPTSREQERVNRQLEVTRQLLEDIAKGYNKISVNAVRSAKNYDNEILMKRYESIFSEIVSIKSGTCNQFQTVM